jgi:hypothetical protein
MQPIFDPHWMWSRGPEEILSGNSDIGVYVVSAITGLIIVGFSILFIQNGHSNIVQILW